MDDEDTMDKQTIRLATLRSKVLREGFEYKTLLF
jgi:hypothetical protein